MRALPPPGRFLSVAFTKDNSAVYVIIHTECVSDLMLGYSKAVRKSIACVLTVISHNQREAVRTALKGKKYIPLDLRQKKTRALRRALSTEQVRLAKYPCIPPCMKQSRNLLCPSLLARDLPCLVNTALSTSFYGYCRS